MNKAPTSGAARLMQRDATVDRGALLSREQRKIFIGIRSGNGGGPRRFEINRLSRSEGVVAHESAQTTFVGLQDAFGAQT